MPLIPSLVYDVENRLIEATHSSNGTDYYQYDPWNRRVWKKKPSGPEETYFYGVDGKKLGTYGGGSSSFSTRSEDVWFAGRPIQAEDQAVEPDRVGSLMRGYYPYGEQRETSTQDRTKFATYYRDGTTSLDYAVNRYYARTIGRFLTADPYLSRDALRNPQEWNRYSYVVGDPVNLNDPSGLNYAHVELSQDSFSWDSGFSTISWAAVEMAGQPLGYQPVFGFWPGSAGNPGTNGGSPGPLTDEDYARLFLPGAIDLIKKAIQTKPECAALFGGNIAPWEVLEDMAVGRRFGRIDFARLRSGIDGLVRPVPDTAVVVEGQTFYRRADLIINSRRDGTKYWAGSASTNVDHARYLLHELGHVFNEVLGLGGSAFKVDVNPDDSPNMEAQAFNKEQEKKCFP